MGGVAAIPDAQTYALMLAGLGLIGWRAAAEVTRNSSALTLSLCSRSQPKIEFGADEFGANRGHVLDTFLLRSTNARD